MTQILDAMRSDAVKDRHWKILMKHFNVMDVCVTCSLSKVNWNFADLTVGQVMDINPLKFQKSIDDVMRQAQVNRLNRS